MMMTQRAFLLSLVVSVVMCRITFAMAANFVRLNVERYEGDPCPLKNKETGVCRKSSLCGQSVRNGEGHCEFEGKEAVVCCAQPPNATFEALTKTVQEACSTVRRIDVKFTFHVVGNAVEALVGEFPFIGLITYEEKEVRCGASLISERFLLSAAHCFRRGTPQTVRLGAIDVNDPGADVYEIAKVHRHENYNRETRQNDIALVELRTSVRMNAQIHPICLHTELIDLPTTTNMTVMGWGIDNTDESSNMLLKGAVSPVLRSSCQSSFDAADTKITLSPNQMCALGSKNADNTATDACPGDSGGPLVFNQSGKYYLAGIVSFGVGCGSESFPGIYTRVSNYLDWIIRTVWQT